MRPPASKIHIFFNETEARRGRDDPSRQPGCFLECSSTSDELAAFMNEVEDDVLASRALPAARGFNSASGCAESSPVFSGDMVRSRMLDLAVRLRLNGLTIGLSGARDDHAMAEAKISVWGNWIRPAAARAIP